VTTELPALSSRHHAGRIARLAWPLLIGQLAIIANGVIDTAMVSRFSALDLGALALGVSIYVSVFVGLSGVLQALQPTIGQLYGAGRVGEIGHEVKQGMWLAVLLSIVGSLILMFSPLFLAVAKASPELVEKATLYCASRPWPCRPRCSSASTPRSTRRWPTQDGDGHAAGRPAAQAAPECPAHLRRPGPACLRRPRLRHRHHPDRLADDDRGLAAGGATAAVSSAQAVRQRLRGALLESQRTLLRLGIPIGMSYFIEVTAFTLMAVFIARLGAVPVAGHQITANVGTVLYMLPLSIASATSTLVAQAIGGGNMQEAKKIGRAGIRLAVSLSVVIGVIVWFLREHIIHAYTPDPVIVGAALPLFLYIAFYQLFDSMQVTTAFVLRAYKVAVVPTVIYAVTCGAWAWAAAICWDSIRWAWTPAACAARPASGWPTASAWAWWRWACWPTCA
jgi:MATE family multidrug resistance protein